MSSFNVDNAPDRTISIKGKEFLYFGGTSYLGLQTLAEFQDILIESIKQYGSNHGASRKANLQFSIYEDAEELLANTCKAEKAITLSSGFLAGQLVSNYFDDDTYDCFFAPKTHEALLGSNTKISTSFDELIDQVSKSKKQVVIFCDAIDFYGANYPDFNWLKNIDLANIILVVDDSHGIGLVGNYGEGIYNHLSHLKVKELLVCASMGKGFGIQAGVILGKEKTINQIKKSPWFAASSPASPAFMATYSNAQHIYQERLQKLKSTIQLFNNELKYLSHFRYMPHYPTYSFQDKRLVNHLFRNDIIITNFPYPNEHSPEVHRIVMSAYHSSDDIKKITAIINDYYG
ncbi:aminotransferase class I/II-fold pyridoxal phosphate-dependent enzyme [Spongiivirga citrea]|uniref:Aminotransferase class I/II-fold pyridoxal phosphate-dependent enzyme n=1 Tax=Spongiivirga citrea TaxID=1481457 RepID=A0A6M0CFS9_9FLAO|nr:aminotransferase class I/II-fold pyridoxal phosphate-dependent enzyme [Spongiivirga citrea]NER15723.1 aminotransferase class I/II-fold pyridoxal phosphate-dependent enzyme [Spongiivirga citrea]